MYFDNKNFATETLTLEGRTITFRAFRNLPYVDKPLLEGFQTIHIFAPEVYYAGGSVNGYQLKTAPIFMPNTVGGYMPGPLEEPGYNRHGEKKLNSIFCALEHGLVVAVPSIRGRVQQDVEGKYIGKAPACIVDYKAAVRYLRHFKDQVPGDVEKIITNGTSAGGALSALMGATGNHPDYEPYLEAIGAAKERDDVFAASCYCPITNLDHGDMAYEWQFDGIYDYHRMNMQMGEGGRPSFTPEDGVMDAEGIRISKEEAALFPDYLNSLGIVDGQGNILTLEADGSGSFRAYVEACILQSADRAMEAGIDAAENAALKIEGKKAVAVDFRNYMRAITRMKGAPAFDDVDGESPENDLFGSETVNCRHFTEYSLKNSRVQGQMAEKQQIKMLNPMYYLEDEKSVAAKNWRIRHGASDRDTSFAVSAILTLKLREKGCEVDYHLPWGLPHSGDYDLEELFAWVDEICSRK